MSDEAPAPAMEAKITDHIWSVREAALLA